MNDKDDTDEFAYMEAKYQAKIDDIEYKLQKSEDENKSLQELIREYESMILNIEKLFGLNKPRGARAEGER